MHSVVWKKELQRFMVKGMGIERSEALRPNHVIFHLFRTESSKVKTIRRVVIVRLFRKSLM
jgi:hypothetical protein